MTDKPIDVVESPSEQEPEHLARNTLESLPDAEVRHEVISHTEADARPQSKQVRFLVILSWLLDRLSFGRAQFQFSRRLIELCGSVWDFGGGHCSLWSFRG